MPKSSTAFDRRKRLLSLLQKQPGIRVPELAAQLQVSQGTVRNDLNALAEAGALERVRGGGVPAEDHPAKSAAFDARFQVQAVAKQRIARWAAELVNDGDTIVLDASTSVYRMAQYLQNHRNLTVITNGIEIGRKLAQNPANTVMLLGGVLRTDGTPVTDLVSATFLKDLHIKTAFVSCAGFTPDAGLTEQDMRDGQLKAGMLAASDAVVALIDSSKFGKTSLAPFARLEQVSHIFTDSDLPRHWIAALQKTCVALTICDEDTVSDFTPCVQETRHYRIGFANLGESMPFAADVRRGLERAAKAAGNIDLVLADNQLRSETALAVADRFVAMAAERALDLVIEYQIDEQIGNRLMEKYRHAGLPVIAVDIPMVGATFFGVDNYRAGHLAGTALGQWINANWEGAIDRLLVLDEPRVGTLPAARIQGQLDGLQAQVGAIPAEKRLVLNSGNTSEISEAAVTEALKRWPHWHRLAVVSFNDDAAIGALAAARHLQRVEDVAIVGQGADRRVREELRDPHSRIIGSTAYLPEAYGEKLIPLALRILHGEPVPPALYMEHTFIRAGLLTEPPALEGVRPAPARDGRL
jgi:ribose transport system substrate-binding protein